MTTHFSNFAWRIPWKEEPGGLQSMGSQRVGRDKVTNTHTHIHTLILAIVSLGVIPVNMDEFLFPGNYYFIS